MDKWRKGFNFYCTYRTCSHLLRGSTEEGSGEAVYWYNWNQAQGSPHLQGLCLQWRSRPFILPLHCLADSVYPYAIAQVPPLFTLLVSHIFTHTPTCTHKHNSDTHSQAAPHTHTHIGSLSHTHRVTETQRCTLPRNQALNPSQPVHHCCFPLCSPSILRSPSPELFLSAPMDANALGYSFVFG